MCVYIASLPLASLPLRFTSYIYVYIVSLHLRFFAYIYMYIYIYILYIYIYIRYIYISRVNPLDGVGRRARWHSLRAAEKTISREARGGRL